MTEVIQKIHYWINIVIADQCIYKIVVKPEILILIVEFLHLLGSMASLTIISVITYWQWYSNILKYFWRKFPLKLNRLIYFWTLPLLEIKFIESFHMIFSKLFPHFWSTLNHFEGHCSFRAIYDLKAIHIQVEVPQTDVHIDWVKAYGKHEIGRCGRDKPRVLLIDPAGRAADVLDVYEVDKAANEDYAE